MRNIVNLFCVGSLSAIALMTHSSFAAGSLSSVDFNQLLLPIENEVVRVAETPRLDDSVTDGGEEAQSEPFLITEELLVDALLRISQASASEQDSLEIELKSKWSPVSLSSDAQWEIYTEDQFAPDNRGDWSPLVALKVDGEIYGKWRVVCGVDLYRPVYMTTQRLLRGDIPLKPAVEQVICNIYEETSRPVPASQNLMSYEMQRNLSEGQFLTWDDITRRPAVRKGDTVDAVFQKGRLSVTMQALSLQDGLVEDIILLKNPRTRAEFAGVISATGVVYVK